MNNYKCVFVGIAGSIAVIAGILVTESATPLWGLLLVWGMMESSK